MLFRSAAYIQVHRLEFIEEVNIINPDQTALNPLPHKHLLLFCKQSRPRSGSSPELPDQSLLYMMRYDPIIVDLTNNFKLLSSM